MTVEISALPTGLLRLLKGRDRGWRRKHYHSSAGHSSFNSKFYNKAMIAILKCTKFLCKAAIHISTNKLVLEVTDFNLFVHL